MRDGRHAMTMTPMRRAIARRMTDSKQRIPHFYATADIEMDSSLAALSELNAGAPADRRVHFSALLVHALASALRAQPTLNAVWDNDSLLLSDAINIGIAIEVPDGLLAPALLGCEQMDLRSTADALNDLVSRARDGKIRAAEWSDATFTLSNLGMFEIKSFSAIIVPPQVGILATGRVEQRPAVRDSEILVRRVMSVTLSADHRAVDGATAARFLGELRGRLEGDEWLAASVGL